MKHLLILLLIFLSSQSAVAGIYEDSVLKIDIPAGFKGPLVESPSPELQLIGYSLPYASEAGGTLFQISKFNIGPLVKPIPHEKLGAASEFYLKQFMAGVERKRTDFTSGPVLKTKLNGIPASRIEWSGRLEGQQMSGVMYCVVAGNVVIMLHTQDAIGAPEKPRKATLRAFDKIVIRRGV